MDPNPVSKVPLVENRSKIFEKKEKKNIEMRISA